MSDQPHPPPPDPMTIEELRSRFGLTRTEFSRLTGAAERSLASWASGDQRPSPARRRSLTELEHLYRALAEVIAPESIRDWLCQPNAGFGGLKPIEVIERGEQHRIWRMIHYLESGMPT